MHGRPSSDTGARRPPCVLHRRDELGALLIAPCRATPGPGDDSSRAKHQFDKRVIDAGNTPSDRRVIAVPVD